MGYVYRMTFWLVFVLLGLLPILLARVKTAFTRREFDTVAFYRDGSLLFFGPAVLMVTIGELLLKEIDIRYSSLLMMSMLVLVLVVLMVASTVYGDLFRDTRRRDATQPAARNLPPAEEDDGDFRPDINLVRRLSLALTISSIVLSCSLTAVFNWKVHFEPRGTATHEAGHNVEQPASGTRDEQKGEARPQNQLPQHGEAPSVEQNGGGTRNEQKGVVMPQPPQPIDMPKKEHR